MEKAPNGEQLSPELIDKGVVEVALSTEGVEGAPIMDDQLLYQCIAAALRLHRV